MSGLCYPSVNFIDFGRYFDSNDYEVSLFQILYELFNQMLFRLLLKFGTVQDSIQYNALTDTFLNSTYTPNGNCSNRACCQWQEEHRNVGIFCACLKADKFCSFYLI